MSTRREVEKITGVQLLEYCLTYQDTIMVREEVNNHFVDSPISQVAGSVLLPYLNQWLVQNKYPSRVRLRDLDN